MFEKILTPITTAAATGVAFRYISTIAASLLAMLGIMGWLSAEQVAGLTKAIPELLAAVAAVWAIAVPIYAMVTKSSSDPAAEVAKQADAILAGEKKDATVRTPAAVPDLKVTATKAP